MTYYVIVCVLKESYKYLNDETTVPGLKMTLEDLLGAIVFGLLPPDEHGDILLNADDGGQGKGSVWHAAHHIHSRANIASLEIKENVSWYE